MTEASNMLKRICELSEESAVEIHREDTRSPPYQDPATVSSTSLDLNSYFNNVAWSNTSAIGGTTAAPYTWGNLTSSHAGGGLAWNNTTITNGTTTSPYTFNPLHTTASSKIQLDGSDADIEINGWSLVDSIKKIEERLNMLTPNPNLEKEWDQLRELGEQYRELEKKLTEQGDMWTKLKAMPPPVIDQ